MLKRLRYRNFREVRVAVTFRIALDRFADNTLLQLHITNIINSKSNS